MKIAAPACVASVASGSRQMPISIVIPYCNREKYLARTLNSVLAQNFRPLELVLVDNNSTDGSAALCAAFARDNSSSDFIVTLAAEQRKGACAARNKGLSVARGAWVYFFDSDDVMSARYVSDLMGIVGKGGGCPDMVCCTTAMLMPDGRLKPRYSSHSQSVGLHLISAMLSTQSMAFSKAWLQAAGGWDESLPCWNDWELAARSLLLNPRVAWLEGRVYHTIIQHPASITGTSLSANKRPILQAIRKVRLDILAAAAQRCSPSTARRAMWALALKAAITAGRMGHEGDSEGKALLMDEALSIIGSSNSRFKPLRRFAIKALCLYAGYGGRGAWRLATMIY